MVALKLQEREIKGLLNFVREVKAHTTQRSKRPELIPISLA